MGISFAGTKLHKLFVERNKYVEQEYHNYIQVNSVNGKRHRGMEWLFLMRVNLAYIILNRKSKTSIVRENAEKKIAGKLPYLDGAESKLYNMGLEIHIAKGLLEYDVISFDIFDTLIFRPFTLPKDLFMILQQKLDYIGFAGIRERAEKKAGDINMIVKGTRQVTIDDIYAVIERETGIPKEYGIKIEFETELELCFANPYMKRIYDLLLSWGKRLIAVSDMYLSSVQIEQLLKRCGYDTFEKIYVSCEHNVGKGSGDLFKLVSVDFKEGTKFCHIGDNYKSDIQEARKNGWDAKHYQNVNDRGNKYRATFAGMSKLIGSAYGGIVNTHLLNCSRTYSPCYEYGFMYGGLYVFGYCNWIHKYAKLHNIDKILFVSRDGAIYQKVFRALFDDIDNQYVYWSRLVCARLVAEKDKNDFLLRIVRHRRHDIFPSSAAALLDMLGLTELTDELSKYKIRPNDYIVESNSGQFENFFIDNWDKVIEIFNRDGGGEKFYKKVIGNSRHVALVDVGWQGSGLLGLKWLIEEKWNINCNVSCLFGGLKSLGNTTNLPELMSNKIEPFLFSECFNRNIFDYFTSKNSNCAMFELFTQAQCPTFERFRDSENGSIKFQFGIPEVENYEKIRDIHSGIYDFCVLYKKIFEKYPFMYNISGYDAIIPFKHITSNLKFIKEQLGDFAFSKNIRSDFEKPYLETIKQIIFE